VAVGVRQAGVRGDGERCGCEVADSIEVHVIMYSGYGFRRKFSKNALLGALCR
jgi:hypothetical protein